MIKSNSAAGCDHPQEKTCGKIHAGRELAAIMEFIRPATSLWP
jgi:hypothetical protein